MYMYEENFKKSNQGMNNVNAEIPQEMPVQNVPAPNVPVSDMMVSNNKKPLTIKKACGIAAAILIVSAIADFFILGGGGLICF